MTAKDYLGQAYRLDAIIKSNQQELKDLQETITCVGGITYSETKTTSQTFSNEANFVKDVIELVDLESKIKEDIVKCISLKEEIRNVINRIENPNERLVLRLKYINFYDWKTIEDELDVSSRTAMRLYNSALNNIQIPKTA